MVAPTSLRVSTLAVVAVVGHVGVVSQVRAVSCRFHVLLVGLLGNVVRRFQELPRARVPCYVVAPKVRRVVPEYEASGSGEVVLVVVLGKKRCATLGRVP